MAGEVTVKVRGLEELKAALAALTPKLRKGALLNALRAGGRVFRDQAKRLTPVLKAPIRRKSGQVVRLPGTVKKAISVRTSKIAARQGDVGVFVNVRPAKGAKFKTTTTKFFGLRIKTKKQTRVSQRGADSPRDPYYWRFIHWGTRHMRGFHFLSGAAKKMGEALNRIEATLGPAIQKLNNRSAK